MISSIWYIDEDVHACSSDIRCMPSLNVNVCPTEHFYAVFSPRAMSAIVHSIIGVSFLSVRTFRPLTADRVGGQVCTWISCKKIANTSTLSIAILCRWIWRWLALSNWTLLCSVFPDCLFKFNHMNHSTDGLLLTDPRRTTVYDQ